MKPEVNGVMKFEMFAIRKLLSSYVEDYLDMITKIQKERDLKTTKLISNIEGKYRNLIDVIHAHWSISCNMEWSEISAKLIDSSQVVEMLNECLYENAYSEEELNHIYCNYNYLDENPYIDVAIRRVLFSIYNTNNVEEIIKLFEKEKEYFGGNPNLPSDHINPHTPFINILKQKFEDKNDVMMCMYKSFEIWFNRKFNCGGYALEIFDWVLCDDKDKDVMVSKILANPSVRLLGESLLQDDEYLVILDATNYHFIKNKDGKFFEKMRCTSNW